MYIFHNFVLIVLFSIFNLLEANKLTSNVNSIQKINRRIFQIIFHYYFYEMNTSNNRINLYLFKRITFDVM